MTATPIIIPKPPFDADDLYRVHLAYERALGGLMLAEMEMRGQPLPPYLSDVQDEIVRLNTKLAQQLGFQTFAFRQDGRGGVFPDLQPVRPVLVS